MKTIIKYLKYIISFFKKSDKTWHGIYKNWDDAAIISTTYENKIILQKCSTALLQVKNGNAKYERDSIIFDKISYSWPVISILFKSSLENNSHLNLIDFGGSLGSLYYSYKSIFENLSKITWSIVEQEKFVKEGEKLFSNNELHFYDKIDDVIFDHNPKIILLSSVIQYIKDPYSLIKYIVKKNFDYIIFDNTSFIDHKNDIITLQTVPKEIYNASYPMWLFNMNTFLENFVDKYEVIDVFSNTINNERLLNKKYRIYWKGIILKKLL